MKIYIETAWQGSYTFEILPRFFHLLRNDETCNPHLFYLEDVWNDGESLTSSRWKTWFHGQVGVFTTVEQIQNQPFAIVKQLCS